MPLEQFWCHVEGCSCSEGYAGFKKSFSRKDKRDDHVRKAHRLAAGNLKVMLLSTLPFVSTLFAWSRARLLQCVLGAEEVDLIYSFIFGFANLRSI